ncbi:YARHG domain-containing protein [candidate division WOR-3 bacterium]|nr:YARHG domain-containing protein [candidate division WOR-3 bacterium]
MRKLMVFILVFQLFIFTNLLSGKAASSSSWLEAEIEYFQEKEYKGNEKIYTEVDFYPPYFTQGEADKEDILRYLRLLRNEVFARRGYVFGSEELKGFFGGMSWYKSELKEVELSEIERSNISRIQREEERYKSGEVTKEKYKEEKYKSKEEGRPGNTEEKYVKKVIIEAKWGSGPGEFALEPLPESYEFTTCFTVGTNGNVYIVDPNNVKINVYSQNGNFLKNIPISDEFHTVYAGEKIASVAGIGVDSKGGIYLGIANGTSFGLSRDEKVMVRIDRKGKIIEKFVFKGFNFVNPLIFYETQDGKIYLWGDWKVSLLSFDLGVVPLKSGKGKIVNIKGGVLSSFKRNRNAIILGNRKIKILENKTPVVFNISEDSRVVYYDGSSFVFQDANGEIKEKLDIHWSYYPPGFGFSYRKRDNILLSAWPYIDKELNIYCIAGTSEGLHVIKYTPNENIWK